MVEGGVGSGLVVGSGVGFAVLPVSTPLASVPVLLLVPVSMGAGW